jgi:hypothetical protein
MYHCFAVVATVYWWLYQSGSNKKNHTVISTGNLYIKSYYI